MCVEKVDPRTNLIVHQDRRGEGTAQVIQDGSVDYIQRIEEIWVRPSIYLVTDVSQDCQWG